MMRRLWITFVLAGLSLGIASQVVVEEIGILQERFEEAQRSVADYQYTEALKSLDPLIKTLSEWEQSGRLQPSDETLLENALALRGMSHHNLGRTSLAEEDYSHLIRLQPNFVLSPNTGSKVRKFFERVRESMTGVLILTVDPPDASLSVNGRDLGNSYPRTLHLLQGIHLLTWSHPGFDADTREVQVEVGTSEDLYVRLVPNSRTIYFFVRPQGTRLTIGDELVGIAELAADSQDDLANYARRNGVDPSTVYVIPAMFLPPGEHRVRLSRHCHLEREFLLDVVLDKVQNVPGYIKPIELERRTVRFDLTSVPPGADAFIDGESAGKTPLSMENFCIGEHRIRLQKPGVGEYRADVTVPEGTTFSLKAALRPSLLWVGLTRNQETTAGRMEAMNETLLRALRRLEQFNSIPSGEDNPVLPETFFAVGVEEGHLLTETERLCEKYQCQGILVGRLHQKDGDTRLTLRLFVPHVRGFDAYEGYGAKTEQVEEVLEQLDRPYYKVRENSVHLADLRGGRGPVVVRGAWGPDGPQAGDILLTIDGESITQAASAREILGREGSHVLGLERSGMSFDWTCRKDPLRSVLVYGGDEAGYRSIMLLSGQEILSLEKGESGTGAAMALSSALLNLGQPEMALQILESTQPDGSEGFSRASVDYLAAVALVHLGRVEEAREALMRSAGDGKASLDGLGEILVQPLALDLLNRLPPPPRTTIPLPGTE